MAKVAAFEHTLTFYNALFKASTDEVANKQKLRVFRGKLTSIYDTCEIPSSYYSEVVRQLEQQGCIERIQKGNRSSESIVVLWRPPEREAWVKTSEKDLTDASEFAKLVADVEEIKKRLGGINIAEALVAIEQRFTQLENNRNTN